MKRTVHRRMIEVADAVDFDSHVPEGEQEDEEKKLHGCCCCCLRKTEGRAAPLAVAADAATVVAVDVAAALSETLGAVVEARKEARIAAALLLPLRWPEVC